MSSDITVVYFLDQYHCIQVSAVVCNYGYKVHK